MRLLRYLSTEAYTPIEAVVIFWTAILMTKQMFFTGAAVFVIGIIITAIINVVARRLS